MGQKAETVEELGMPQSVQLLASGVVNSRQFIRAMSLLMGDIAAGKVSPGQGNAICNVAGKHLKCVELEQRYGKQYGQRDGKLLSFDGETEQLQLADQVQAN